MWDGGQCEDNLCSGAEFPGSGVFCYSVFNLSGEGLAFDPQLLKWMMNAGMEEQKWSYEPCAVSVSNSGDAQVAGN